MLRHIVCWKLKGTAEEQERVVCRFREMMDDLQKILPEILSCSIGVNLHEGEEASISASTRPLPISRRWSTIFIIRIMWRYAII